MRAPVLAVGDGSLGFWKALAEVFPASRHQRCWVHKTANVLNALPKSAQPGARKTFQDIYKAEDRDLAVKAITTFAQLCGAKFPKAVKKITDDEAELLALYDFPAEHWIHLRTTNPIESTFATVRLRLVGVVAGVQVDGDVAACTAGSRTKARRRRSRQVGGGTWSAPMPGRTPSTASPAAMNAALPSSTPSSISQTRSSPSAASSAEPGPPTARRRAPDAAHD